MDNADNPPRKPPARPFFAPRSPAKTSPTPASPSGRSAARPFTSRTTPSGNPVPASERLGAALPPGEDSVAPAPPDQLVVAPAAKVGTREAQVGELAQVAIPQTELASLDIGSATAESPSWRPSDKFDEHVDAVEDPVGDASSLHTEPDAMGVVDIMDWMPVPVSPASSSQESTATTDAHRSMPTLATPAFGALTVRSGSENSAAVSGEKLGPPASANVDADPGDVWKWGEPSTTAIPENATAVGGKSHAAAADLTTGQSDEIRPHGGTQAELSESLEQTKVSEPWTTTSAKPDERRGHAIGDALERVAKRIREGTIVLPADTSASNDEAALALALAALLRGRSD